jgi:hypothetical protein
LWFDALGGEVRVAFGLRWSMRTDSLLAPKVEALDLSAQR